MTSDQLELPLLRRGAAPAAQRSGEARPAASGPERPEVDDLMARVVERTNLSTG